MNIRSFKLIGGNYFSELYTTKLGKFLIFDYLKKECRKSFWFLIPREKSFLSSCDQMVLIDFSCLPASFVMFLSYPKELKQKSALSVSYRV